jgi:hypothetical protein
MMVREASARRNAFHVISLAAHVRVSDQIPYASCGTGSLKDRDLNALPLKMRCSNDTTNACANYRNTFTGERHARNFAKTIR